MELFVAGLPKIQKKDFWIRTKTGVDLSIITIRHSITKEGCGFSSQCYMHQTEELAYPAHDE